MAKGRYPVRIGDHTVEDGTNLLVVAMSWAAQLTVAIFFIAGFVSFYTEVWNRAFSD